MLTQPRSKYLRSYGPLYVQIAMSLKREIAERILKPGEQLPAISDLASRHNVAIVTVRQAIAVLEDEGLLRRQQGRGTFVSNAPKVADKIVLKSDWASLLAHLGDKKPKLLKVADKVARPLLDPKLGELDQEYRFMRRVHSSKGTPYAVINIYLSQRVYEMDPATFDEGMVISRLHQLPNIEIGRLRQRINFTTADPETAKLLNLPVNAAVGDVLRVITDKDGVAIYVGHTKYHGDFVSLEFDLEELPHDTLP